MSGFLERMVKVLIFGKILIKFFKLFLRIQCQNAANAVILEHERQRVRALRNSSNQIPFASNPTKTMKYRDWWN